MNGRPRRRRSSLIAASLVVVAVASFGGIGHGADGTGASSTAAAGDACDTPQAAVGGPRGRSTFVDRATFVTALAWAPDGRLFFAERAGAIRIASGGTVRTFTTVPTTTSEPSGFLYSERGLLGLALSPSFPINHFVYAFYSEQNGSRRRSCASPTARVRRATSSGWSRCPPAAIAATRAGGSHSVPTASCTPRSATSTR